MADENNITTLAKRLRPFIKMAAQEMVPVTPYDHGDLTGLASDDHTQYVHNTTARTITAVHTFDPTSATAPFIIAADGQGQTVIGLKADQLNKGITAGDGLTGGGNLTGDVSLAVGAGSGIVVGADLVSIDLASPSGLTFSSGDLALADTVAGDGLTISSKILAINLASPSGLVITTDQLQVADGIAGAGLTIASKVLAIGQGAGLTVVADEVALTTPGTLSYNSTNSSSGSHTHAISNSSNPGAAASILSTDSSGVLTLVTLKTEVLQDRGITGSILINPTGDITLDPGGFDVLPYANYEIRLGSINKKYLTLWAAELWVETLVAQDTMATIGGRILIAPTTVLTQDFAAAATTMHVKHNQMVNGDRVYLEADGKVEFIAITSGPTAETGGYYYSCSRNLDGSGANDWYAGDAVLNTGTTGDGYIDIYSLDSIRSGTQYGPTIVGNIRTGATYSDLIEGWAIGNLNGLYGYGVDTYGAAFGKYVINSSFLAIDPTNGIRMIWKNGSGANLALAQWDISGNLTIGQTGASQDNIYIASGAISLRVNTTTYINLTTGGVITIGQVGASQDNIYMSAGAISIRNNTTERIGMTAAGVMSINNSAGSAVFTFNSSSGAEFTLPLTLATGGGIYQGTGTFASPTTGLKIYNSSGIGMIAGYAASVVQWYGNTDGKLYAGAGKVILDSTGISLVRSTVWGEGMLKWTSGGVIRSRLDTDDGGLYLEQKSNDGTRTAAINLIHTSGGVRNINFQAGSGAYWEFTNASARGYAHFTWSHLGIDGGVHIGADYGACYDNDLIVDGGIAVGTTFDVGAGNIYATGTLYAGGRVDFNNLLVIQGDFHMATAMYRYSGGTGYACYAFVPLYPPHSSTSWNGNTFYTVGNTLFDVNAIFTTPSALPAGMRGVVLAVTIRDLGATDTNDAWIAFTGASGGTQYCSLRATQGTGQTTKYTSTTMVVPLDANGDCWYRIACTATGLQVFITVQGYFI